jgi:hypothetical protein
VIAVVGVIAVVDVAVEAVRAMEPGACSDEQAATEPVGAVVAVGGAVVWGVVEVSVRAYRGHADTDGDLGGSYVPGGEQQCGGYGGKCEGFQIAHPALLFYCMGWMQKTAGKLWREYPDIRDA